MKKNKFLQRYPQLREPEVGDIIEIIDNKILYRLQYGDIGIIIELTSPIIIQSLYYIDFQINPGGNTGKWCLYRHEFKIIKYHE